MLQHKFKGFFSYERDKCDNYVPQWLADLDYELSWLFTKKFRYFLILFEENSQILLKISVIPILFNLSGM